MSAAPSSPIESEPSSASLAERVARHRWYHSIELPGGIVTKGVVDNRRVLERYGLPASLEGKSVLDIGAWDGFYSFECAKRGARDVLATDSHAWEGRGWGSKRPFELARTALGLTDVVRDQNVDPTELSPEAIGGTFDVVLFLGVLYHLESPVNVLRRVAQCCGDLLILETESTMNWARFPAARLYPGEELNGDRTNWFQFNSAALHGLLREFGFATSTTVFRTPILRRLARSFRDRRANGSIRAGFRSSRIVIHARKLASV